MVYYSISTLSLACLEEIMDLTWRVMTTAVDIYAMLAMLCYAMLCYAMLCYAWYSKKQ